MTEQVRILGFVNHTAPAPTSIPAGSAFGSMWWATRPVCESRRVSSPEDGATHTSSPRAATAPGLPSTTLPIRTARPIASNSGSIRLTTTEFAVELEFTIHTRPLEVVAIPVGGPGTLKFRSVRRVTGSIRETV